MAKQDERFIKVYEQGMINCMEIWVDRETGVNYLFHFNGNAAGLTPLLDADGKPVVTHLDESDQVMMGQLLDR